MNFKRRVDVHVIPAPLLTHALAGATVKQRDGDAGLARPPPHLAFAVILKGMAEIQLRCGLVAKNTRAVS